MQLKSPSLWVVTCVAVLSLFLAMGAGVLLGSSGWGWPAPEILWQIRIPRVLAAGGVGAALALAGALIQLVTRNPLSDPHILGVTGGASVGAVLTLFWVPGMWAGGTAVGAVVGAFLSMSAVLVLSWRSLARGRRVEAQPGSVVVLLVGLMVSMASGAGVSLLLSLSNDQQLRSAVFWLMGDFNGVTQFWPVWIAVFLGLAVSWPIARQLDWMSRGDAWAWTLGVPVAQRRRWAIIAASLVTGAAVATAGSVGFVGLVAPHMVRLCGLRQAQVLLPFSALFGGIFLVLADTAARTLWAPTQLPVGVVCSAVGVPLFLMLLLRRRG